MSLPSNLPGLNFQLGEDIDALRDAVATLPSQKLRLVQQKLIDRPVSHGSLAPHG